MVPIDKAEKRLRPVSKMPTLRRLLMDILPGEPGNLPKDYKERAEQTGSKLKSGKIKRWIEVVRDLTCLKDQRPLCQTDRRGLDRAIHLLTTELALVQEIDPEKAERHLASLVQHRHEFKDRQTDTQGWWQTLKQRVLGPFTDGKTRTTADAS